MPTLLALCTCLPWSACQVVFVDPQRKNLPEFCEQLRALNLEVHRSQHLFFQHLFLRTTHILRTTHPAYACTQFVCTQNVHVHKDTHTTHRWSTGNGAWWYTKQTATRQSRANGMSFQSSTSRVRGTDGEAKEEECLVSVHGMDATTLGLCGTHHEMRLCWRWRPAPHSSTPPPVSVLLYQRVQVKNRFNQSLLRPREG